MLRRNLKRAAGVLAVLCALAFAPATSQAASVTLTPWTGGPLQTDFAEDNSATPFAQFNPALGTLDSVEITLDATTYSTFYVLNNSNTRTFSGSVNVEVGLEGFSGVTLPTGLSLILSENTAPFSVDGGADKTVGPETTNANQTWTLTTDLAQFVGNGTYSFIIGTANNSVVNGSGNFFGSVSSDGAWEVTVKYNYTPTSAVPEPSSLALLGLGCIGFVARRRLSRRKAEIAA